MKSTKKLALNKATIAKLDPIQMNAIAGGLLPPTKNIIFPTGCVCPSGESCGIACVAKF